MKNRNLLLFLAGFLILLVGGTVVRLRIQARQQTTEQAARIAAAAQAQADQRQRAEQERYLQAQQQAALQSQREAIERERLRLLHEQQRFQQEQYRAAQQAAQMPNPPRFAPQTTRIVESGRPPQDIESRVNELELREEQRQRYLREIQERQHIRDMMRNGGGSIAQDPNYPLIENRRVITSPPRYQGRGYTSPGYIGQGGGRRR